MRFHHSTRRGRTKFSQGGGPHHRAHGGGSAGHSSVSNRWAQLSYCRQTNIHFHRRLPVEVPESARLVALAQQQAFAQDQPDDSPNGPTLGQLERRLDELKLEESTAAAGRLQVCQQQDLASAELDTQPEVKTMPESKKKRASVCAQEPPAASNKEAGGRGSKLDIESAREKMIAQVDKHPFWSNKAARRMRLLELIERRVFIYELVSYCEKRDLEWRYEPYRGGLVAGTGPFAAGAHQQQAGSGVRRVASSQPDASFVGQQQQALARRKMTAQVGGGATSTPTSAATSQPASPVISADSSFQVNGLVASDSGERAQSSEPPAPATEERLGKVQLASQSNELSSDSKFSTRRQTIRRSCSSAASSPVHQFSRPTSWGLDSPTSMSAGAEPRPLPSAEFVWSIEPPAHLRPAPFASYIHTTEVPDSSFVKRCHGCQGRGRLKCTSCYGVGYEVCISCSGKGTMKSLSSSGANSSGHHHHQNGSSSGRPGGGGDSSGGTVGSMWSNAAESHSSESRLGSGRYNQPGGISGGAHSGGSALGAWTTESCHFCHGAGQKRCWICAGRSYNTCTACAGTGQLRCFLNLNITWLNHRDECVLNNADAIIPRDRLKLSSGLLLADESAPRLEPLAPTRGGGGSARSGAHLADPSAGRRSRDGATTGDLLASVQARATPAHRRDPDDAPAGGGSPLEQLLKPAELAQLQTFSGRLLERHASNYQRGERLLRQRQRVTQIECYLVNWEWKRRRGHFVIYGNERKVYIAKYPFKSLCNIT